MLRQPMVYIMTNKPRGVLYTGVTSKPAKRIYEHKNGILSGFTKKYQCKVLVYFEHHESMSWAIYREKQIKAGSRERKLCLIEGVNPEWLDLYDQVV